MSSCCELLYWKNPVETGKVFGGALVALLFVKKVNLITVLLRLAYTVMLATGSVEFASKMFLGQGLVSKYGPQQCPNIVGCVKPSVDAAFEKFPKYQAQLRQLVFAAKPQATLRAAAVLYVVHKLYSLMSLWTMLFVGTIGVFTVPMVYKTYQREIDATVAQGVEAGKQQAQALQSTVSEKAGPYVKQLDEKLGPVSKFMKSKANAAGIAPQSTTSKLAADVPLEKTTSSPLEEHTSAKTSSADFPTAPSTKLGHEVVEDATLTGSHIPHKETNPFTE
ncbi:LAMI_0B05182g1_1 [Lachancea mirantina]|uniref:Reticulon-like protein n=1 Tax=Lachancea mirantina TaxID=1230905 RepID=A0A1G4IVX9_9SACH|nr:LAMI_0B05182g1_1 [Lachancea mirantina]